jgi:15-hydroxyprostaglandin dehydrogenase (NAD)
MLMKVNNAGIAERGDVLSDPLSNWRMVLDIDLAAVIEGTRLAVGFMTGSEPALYSRGGVIVNVASAGGLFPMPFSPVYAAAKAGVVMFCQSLESLCDRPNTPVAVRDMLIVRNILQLVFL